jgi:hypothetical protein
MTELPAIIIIVVVLVIVAIAVPWDKLDHPKTTVRPLDYRTAHKKYFGGNDGN